MCIFEGVFIRQVTQFLDLPFVGISSTSNSSRMLAKNGLHLMKFVDPNFRASPRKGKAKREGVTLGVPLSPSVDTLGNFTTELVSCVICISQSIKSKTTVLESSTLH